MCPEERRYMQVVYAGFVLGVRLGVRLGFQWWAIRDSNPGPTGYEPVALTN